MAWYADQGIHAQTCSAEDLELIYDTVEHDTVEHETAAFYSRQQAAHRGYSVPASNSLYQSNNNQTPQERQAKVFGCEAEDEVQSLWTAGTLATRLDLPEEKRRIQRQRQEQGTRARFRVRGSMMANHRRALRDRHRDHQASPGLSTSR